MIGYRQSTVNHQDECQIVTGTCHPANITHQLHMFRLNFLGQTEIVVGEGEGEGTLIELVSEKQISLLAYLAITKETYTRPQLETLLWGDTEQEKAQTSLRTAVYKLNKEVRGLLKTTRKTIELDLETDIAVDVSLFEKLIQSHKLADLENAVRLYRGEFLAGMTVPDSPEFEYWLLQTRERLRLSLLEGLEILTERYSASKRFESASEAARRYLDIEPWHESVHRTLMMLYARQGKYAEALKQYQRCVEVLEEELGVPPMQETESLYQRILALRQQGPNQTLPPAPHPFMGRDQELETLASFIADPPKRLITITGPGGIGKTGLAIIVGHAEKGNFLEGVIYIELAGLEQGSLLETSIGSAINLSFPPGTPPRQHLSDYFHDKELLLILDNAEHLLSEVESLIQELINTAPGIKILITSRQALRLRNVVHYPLDGLATPETTQTREDFPAATLFATHAQEIIPDFNLVPEWETIVELCRLVEGSPLGIELAAAQLDIHSCAEILSELAASLTLLEVEYQDMPPRHRSLKALFNHTQGLLSADEQAAITKLALFRGGFTREGASGVSNISPRLLRKLVNKSLIKKDQKGDRFFIHSLIRQFARDLLHEDDPIHTAHATYFASHLIEVLEQPGMEKYKSLQLERENLQAMWQFAVENADQDLLTQIAHPLARYLVGNNLFSEGEILFGEGINYLSKGNLPHINPILWGILTSRQAMFLLRTGNIEESATMIEIGVESLTGRGDDFELAFSLNLESVIYIQIGRFKEALIPLETCADIYRKLELENHLVKPLVNLGSLYSKLGNIERSIDHLNEALILAEKGNDRQGRAHILNNLGGNYLLLNRLDEAKVSLLETVTLSNEIENYVINMMAHANLAEIYSQQEEWEQCIQHAEAALAAGEKRNEQVHHVRAMKYIGLALIKLDQPEQGWPILKEALLQAHQSHNLPNILNVLVRIALLLVDDTARRALGILTLQLVLSHPSTEQEAKFLAEAWINQDESHKKEIEQTEPSPDINQICTRILANIGGEAPI